MAAQKKKPASRSAAARRRGGAAKGRQPVVPVVPVIIGGVVVLGIVAIIAVALTGNKKGSDNGIAQTRPVTVQGAALASMTKVSGTNDPAVGQTAPTVVGENFSGKKVTIGNDGHPKVVVLVAHWCPHCRVEVPRISTYLANSGLPKNVEMFFVPTSTSSVQPNYPPSKWLAAAGVGDMPTLVDDKKDTAFTAFGGASFPYLVFLDKDNKVVWRHAGELPEGSYPTLLNALAAGQPISLSGTGSSSG